MMPAEPRVIHQVCAIPFRRIEDRVEFCLITSLKRQRWIFPKGIIDPGETFVETALKEAFEEAGLHGNVVGQPLGEYEDAKWGARLYVQVVLLEVSRCDQQWAESEYRQRCWVSRKEALRLLSQAEHRQFLRLATAGQLALAVRKL